MFHPTHQGIINRWVNKHNDAEAVANILEHLTTVGYIPEHIRQVLIDITNSILKKSCVADRVAPETIKKPKLNTTMIVPVEPTAPVVVLPKKLTVAESRAKRDLVRELRSRIAELESQPKPLSVPPAATPDRYYYQLDFIGALAPAPAVTPPMAVIVEKPVPVEAWERFYATPENYTHNARAASAEINREKINRDPKECPYCHMVISHAGAYATHVKSCTGPRKEPIFTFKVPKKPCPECGKEIAINNWWRHYRCVHPDKPRPPNKHEKAKLEKS